MDQGLIVLLESSYLGFHEVIDGESTRPNGVKNPDDIVTPRTRKQQHGLTLNHMKGNMN